MRRSERMKSLSIEQAAMLQVEGARSDLLALTAKPRSEATEPYWCRIPNPLAVSLLCLVSYEQYIGRK